MTIQSYTITQTLGVIMDMMQDNGITESKAELLTLATTFTMKEGIKEDYSREDVINLLTKLLINNGRADSNERATKMATSWLDVKNNLDE
jgi:hypothetical protein